MKPIAQMTDEERIQYVAWEQAKWGRILVHLHHILPALTPQERTARRQAALNVYNETFDDYLASLPPPSDPEGAPL